jgi:hypothetical protein
LPELHLAIKDVLHGILCAEEASARPRVAEFNVEQLKNAQNSKSIPCNAVELDSNPFFETLKQRRPLTGISFHICQFESGDVSKNSDNLKWQPADENDS